MMKLIAVLTALLLPFSAGAVSTSTNIDIIVTHPGSLITSYTFINNGSLPLNPGFPVTIGQAFRRGDLLPGQYPLLRDGADHTNLVWQMDEVATRWQNSDDKSLRHAAFSFQLPATSSQYVGGVVPPGGTYKVEFLSQTGAYSAVGSQTLATLCSGGAGAHDLKVRLTDVRNQDDSLRDTGAGTFSICANANNSGRDAPRHLWAGPVLDLYEVRGPLVYDTTSHQDPLLYFVCDVYLPTKASDQTSLGDVKWVCAVHNSWMNVAAGSAGNYTSGPVGFANDPQGISYRPSVMDGANTILEWGALDATLASSSNPVEGAVCGSDYQATIPNCLNVPGSTGQNAWYWGQATRATCTGSGCVPVGGLNSGQLYFVYNAGVSAQGPSGSNLVAFKNGPALVFQYATQQLGASQGIGSTNFSFRVWHGHNLGWLTLDPSGAENWTSGTNRVTHDILPALATAEKTYWEETGLVSPIYLGQTGINVAPAFTSANLDANYHPLGRNNVFGTGATGERPDLGVMTEFAAQAFVRGTPADWSLARLYSLSTMHYAAATMLNEETGRIPALNNGPPSGPGGNGVGGVYSQLGTPFTKSLGDTASPLENVPVNGVEYRYGFWGTASGTDVAHEPAFNSITYALLGGRHYLDMIYLHSNRNAYLTFWGNGDTNSRDFTINGNHYWGLFINTNQTRGSAWSFRDRVDAAIYGADSNQESQYNNDIVTENSNYYPQFLSYKDGPGNSNYSNSITPPDNIGGAYSADTFVSNYLMLAAYHGWTTLRTPLAKTWLTQLQRFINATCGEGAVGHLSAFYCIDYVFSPAVHNGQWLGPNAPAIGQYMNGTDASDFGAGSVWPNLLAGGVFQQANGNFYALTAGDTMKNLNITAYGPSAAFDQLPPDQWMTITGPIDNNAGTFHVLCPASHPVDASCPSPGTGAFTNFTRSGVIIEPENAENFIFRPTYSPSTSYHNTTYVRYGGELMTGLQIVGYDVSNALAIWNTRAGVSWYNSSGYPSQYWDLSVVVP